MNSDTIEAATLQTLSVLFIKIPVNKNQSLAKIILESLGDNFIQGSTPNIFHACFQSSKTALDNLEIAQRNFANENISLLLHTLDTSLSKTSTKLFESFEHLLSSSEKEISLISRTTYLTLLPNDRPTIAPFVDPNHSIDCFYLMPGPQNSELHVYSPAKEERRTRATIIDYTLSVSIILLVLACLRLPHTLSVIESRRRIEAENLDLHLAKKEPGWLASGGETIVLGKNSEASYTFLYENGDYYISFSYLQNRIQAIIEIGDSVHRIHLPATPGGTLKIFTTADRYHINYGDQIVLRSIHSLDYIEFSKDSEARYPYRTTMRYEDLIYPLGIEKVSLALCMDVAWLMFFLAPVLLTLLQFFFLAFSRYTPGCLISSIMIVDRVGRPPGPWRSMLRFLVNISSPLFFFASQLWPLLTHQPFSWADYLSGTQVVNREDSKNGW